MTREDFDTRLSELAERLLDKVNAACDFDKPGDAADYASAMKDTLIAKREQDDD